MYGKVKMITSNILHLPQLFLSYQGSISPTCLCKAFSPTDRQSTKKTDSLAVFLHLLGSAGIIATQKMLIELTSAQ